MKRLTGYQPNLLVRLVCENQLANSAQVIKVRNNISDVLVQMAIGVESTAARSKTEGTRQRNMCVSCFARVQGVSNVNACPTQAITGVTFEMGCGMHGSGVGTLSGVLDQLGSRCATG